MTTQLLIYLLEVNACLVVFYLLYRLFLQKETFFSFNTLSDGKVYNFEVVKSAHPLLDQEALRAIQAVNVPWKPAMKDGKAQATKLLLTIGFFLAY